MKFDKEPIHYFKGVANTGLFTHKFLPQKQSHHMNTTVKKIKEKMLK